MAGRRGSNSSRSGGSLGGEFPGGEAVGGEVSASVFLFCFLRFQGLPPPHRLLLTAHPEFAYICVIPWLPGQGEVAEGSVRSGREWQCLVMLPQQLARKRIDLRMNFPSCVCLS